MGNLDKSAASSYVYARASGLLSKSFVGANANRLFSVQSLRELYTLLFDSEIPSVPEVMLAKEIEVKAAENFITLYKSLLSLRRFFPKFFLFTNMKIQKFLTQNLIKHASWHFGKQFLH